MTLVAGELESLGFDEVEPGVVEDTPDNRTRIYKLDGQWQFDRVLDEFGQPTGFIRPVSGEVMKERRLYAKKIYRDLLVDPDNIWSDYVGPDDWPMDAYAPWWVEDRLRRWRRQDAEGVPVGERRPFPIRCTWIRKDETRCWMWVGSPDKTDVCQAHLRSKSRDESRIRLALKGKLLDMSWDMVDGLERLSLQGDTDTVKLKAMTEVLDRAGVRGGVELDHKVELDVDETAGQIADKLNQLAQRTIKKRELEERSALPPAATVEGEVVADDSRPDRGE